MKLSQSNFNLRPPDCYLVRSYLIATVTLPTSYFHTTHYKKNNFPPNPKVCKGPAAKNDTTENPGCFNQILSFESRKWSPVATF